MNQCCSWCFFSSFICSRVEQGEKVVDLSDGGSFVVADGHEYVVDVQVLLGVEPLLGERFLLRQSHDMMYAQKCQNLDVRGAARGGHDGHAERGDPPEESGEFADDHQFCILPVDCVHAHPLSRIHTQKSRRVRLSPVEESSKHFLAYLWAPWRHKLPVLLRQGLPVEHHCELPSVWRCR